MFGVHTKVVDFLTGARVDFRLNPTMLEHFLECHKKVVVSICNIPVLLASVSLRVKKAINYGVDSIVAKTVEIFPLAIILEVTEPEAPFFVDQSNLKSGEDVIPGHAYKSAFGHLSRELVDVWFFSSEYLEMVSEFFCKPLILTLELHNMLVDGILSDSPVFKTLLGVIPGYAGNTITEYDSKYVSKTIHNGLILSYP